MIEALVLSIPRIAAARPQAAPAILKSILNNLNVTNKVIDINLDYWDSLQPSIDPVIFNEIDEYLFIHNKNLGPIAQQCWEQWLDKWIKNVLEYKPKRIFISIFSWQAQRFAVDWLTRLRPQSNVEIIIGGQGLIREDHGSYSDRPGFAHYMKDKGLIDHWIRGEAETTIPAIIANNYFVPGIDTDFLAERSDVKKHGFMDFSDFDIKKYQGGYDTGVLPMETSRGCVRNCVFCDIPKMQGGFRFKSGDQLADEMIHYYERYGVSNFFFNDALCNGSVKDFRQFNTRLIQYYEQHGLPDRSFKYCSHAIIHNDRAFKPRDFELMGRGGADTMVLGIETGSDRVREHMQKKFTNVDLDYNMKQYSKNKIQVYMLILIGFPTETREDFDETLKMLSRYQKYVADGTVIGVNLGSTLSIEEGAPMYDDPGKLKIIGINGAKPKGVDWMCEDNMSLTLKERIMRRLEAQEYAVKLGYTFWKGDDQIKTLTDIYQERIRKLAGVIHE